MLYLKSVPRKKVRPLKKKHQITCQECGARDRVNFSPKGIAPVLCRRCFKKRQKNRRR